MLGARLLDVKHLLARLGIMAKDGTRDGTNSDTAVAGAGIDAGLLTTFVGYHIRLTQLAVFRRVEAELDHVGLTPPRYALLTLIKANPGLVQSRLAEAVVLDRSTLVPALDCLAGEGLIERRPSPTDKRSNSIWITAKGSRVLATLEPKIVALEERLASGLSEADRRKLVGMLRRIRANAQEIGGG